MPPELGKAAVLTCLSPMAVPAQPAHPAQPAQVVGGERTQHVGWPQHPRHIDGKLVIHLVGRIAAHLAERVLYLRGMLTGCNAIGVQAVRMLARPDMRRSLVALAADAVHWRFNPPDPAVNQAPGMVCRMVPVVQHEAPELAPSDWSFYAMPQPLETMLRREVCRLSTIPEERL